MNATVPWSGIVDHETWEMDIVETIEGKKNDSPEILPKDLFVRQPVCTRFSILGAIMCTIGNVENSLDSRRGSRYLVTSGDNPHCKIFFYFTLLSHFDLKL
jgi:hypothetical protein